jgi:hypothetical protein
MTEAIWRGRAVVGYRVEENPETFMRGRAVGIAIMSGEGVMRGWVTG